MEQKSIRVIASTLLALLLLGNVACTSTPQANDQWQPSKTIPGGFRRDLVGDTSQPGPFKYQLKIPAGTRVAAHRHTRDVHVKVLSGSIFIVIGEPLDPSRARHLRTGNAFVVLANAMHEEWWDEETILEAEGVGPMETVYKSQTAGASPSY
ncbi:MAG TPA: cupin domain-containing protein [Pyrinomonadaceae bacterium]